MYQYLIFVLLSYLLRDIIWKIIIVSIYIFIFPFLTLPYVILCKVLNIKTDIWRFITKYTFLLGNIKSKFYGEDIINKGIIITNHIGLFDGGIDNLSFNSEGIFRDGVYYYNFLIGLITYLENWGICINREKTSRHLLIDLIEKKLKNIDRILLYPEGTRKKEYWNNQTISKEDIKKMIKPGTLVSIYEKNIPIQVIIGLNKHKILDFSIFGGNVVPYYVCEPIEPHEFKTVDEYLEKIYDQWYDAYQMLIQE